MTLPSKWLVLALLALGPVAEAQTEAVSESHLEPGPPVLVLDAELARDVVELAELRARLAEVEAELAALRSRCEALGGPAGFILGGWVDAKGVRALPFDVKVLDGDTSGLWVAAEGWGYRSGNWAAVALRVGNLPGRLPWTPGHARLLRADGTAVKVRAVRLDRARLAAGEEGGLVVETEAPSWPEGEPLLLELVDESGTRVLSVGEVRL